MVIVVNILILLFLDIILSIDNAILISSVTKDLKGSDGRIATILGATGAVGLRLIFVVLVMVFFELLAGVPAIYIVGGLLLIVIGWTVTKEESHKPHDSSSKVLKAIAIIMAADIMMSFDNAFIIADITLGFDWPEGANVLVNNIIVLSVALLLSLIIIVFSSRQLSKLMVKNKWIIYVASWLIFSVGVEMILKDALIIDWAENINEWLRFFYSYLIGATLTMFNWYYRDLTKRKRPE